MRSVEIPCALAGARTRDVISLWVAGTLQECGSQICSEPGHLRLTGNCWHFVTAKQFFCVRTVCFLPGTRMTEHMWRALDGHSRVRQARLGDASPVLPALAHSWNLARGGMGETPAAAGRQGRIALTLAAARIGPGALRGRSPRTREAACGRPPRIAVISG